MLAAMRVKSPFSQRALFGFIVLSNRFLFRSPLRRWNAPQALS
jgi:hypothetical protein